MVDRRASSGNVSFAYYHLLTFNVSHSYYYRKGDLAGTNKANKSTTLKVAGVRVQSSSVRVHVQLLIVRLVVVPVVVLAILVGPLLNQQDQQSRSMLQQPNAGFTVRFLSLFCAL